MNPLRYVKVVLWSFVGIGRREDAAQLNKDGSPLILLAIAFVLLVVFLGVLVFVAQKAASWA